MKQFKIMIAILIMAMAGVSLAVDDTIFENGSTNESSNSGDYGSNAFNFSEYSEQDVQSTINDNAVVHGDSSANVAGNQYNCTVEGSCASGDNSGVQANLTSQSGQIIGQNDIGGHEVSIQVPVFTYQMQYSTEVLFTKNGAKSANLSSGAVVGDSNYVSGGDIKVAGGTELGYSKIQERVTAEDVARDPSLVLNAPKTRKDTSWVAYNGTEAALIQSNNNVKAQEIAANANTTQTVISAPSMAAPSINASNSDMCRHGVSGSGSMVGLGFSAGVTLIDKNCELIKQVRLLSNLGLSDVALALLGQDERVALAMFQADPERYSKFLNSETVRDLEAESANAEAVVNGDEVKYQNADADQVIIDGDVNGSDDDNKQAKSLGANGYPLGDLLNLPIFNWLN